MSNLTIQELEANKAILKQKYDLAVLENFISVNIDQNPNNVEVGLIQETDAYKAISRIFDEHKNLNTIDVVWSVIEEMMFHISNIMGHYELKFSEEKSHFILVENTDYTIDDNGLFGMLEMAKNTLDAYHYPDSMHSLIKRLIKRAVEVRNDKNATKSQQYVLTLSYALSVTLRNRAKRITERLNTL